MRAGHAVGLAGACRWPCRGDERLGRRAAPGGVRLRARWFV